MCRLNILNIRDENIISMPSLSSSLSPPPLFINITKTDGGPGQTGWHGGPPNRVTHARGFVITRRKYRHAMKTSLRGNALM